MPPLTLFKSQRINHSMNQFNRVDRSLIYWFLKLKLFLSRFTLHWDAVQFQFKITRNLNYLGSSGGFVSEVLKINDEARAGRRRQAVEPRWLR